MSYFRAAALIDDSLCPFVGKLFESYVSILTLRRAFLTNGRDSIVAQAEF